MARKRLTVAQQREIDYNTRFSEDQETLREWVELWSREMVTIWKAKLSALSTERDWWVPTPIRSQIEHPHLMDSPSEAGIVWNNPAEPIAGFTVSHTFLLYGIFVDAGVGGEMRNEEKGGMVRNSLGQFLPNQMGMTQSRGGKWKPTRKAKHWYSTAYWRSCSKLLEEMQDDYTGNFVFLMMDLQKSLSFARLKKKANELISPGTPTQNITTY